MPKNTEEHFVKSINTLAEAQSGTHIFFPGLCEGGNLDIRIYVEKCEGDDNFNIYAKAYGTIFYWDETFHLKDNSIIDRLKELSLVSYIENASPREIVNQCKMITVGSSIMVYNFNNDQSFSVFLTKDGEDYISLIAQKNKIFKRSGSKQVSCHLKNFLKNGLKNELDDLKNWK